MLVVVILGIREQNDVHDFRIMADSFLHLGGDIPAFFAANKNLPLATDYPTGTDYPYLGVVALISGLKLLMGQSWPTGFIIANVAAISAATTILLGLARWSKISVLATILGAMTLALNWELVHWVAYVGTDIIFLPVVAIVFLVFACGCLSEVRVKRIGLFFLAIILATASMAVLPSRR